MERARSRYLIFGLTDGLFLGLGISLGISVFNSYQLTLTSILLVGISGSLSNFFSTYNAENFILGQQIKEYQRILFSKDYNPHKITNTKRSKNLGYAITSFISTLIGSTIVLSPYIAFYALKIKQDTIASILSLIVSLIILSYVGSYSVEKLGEKIKEGAKTAGIGLIIAGASTVIGLLINTFI